MKQNLKEYMLLQTEKLLSIPSPTGYTREVSNYLMAELESMGYAPYTLNKGGVICRLNEGENALMLAAHVDTLGAMVKTIKGNGALLNWWLEAPNTYDDMWDGEESRDALLMVILGYYDHVKNWWSKKERMENQRFRFVSVFNGRRESRRLIGDHILTQNDCIEARKFEDTVTNCREHLSIRLKCRLPEHLRLEDLFSEVRHIVSDAGSDIANILETYAEAPLCLGSGQPQSFMSCLNGFST